MKTFKTYSSFRGAIARELPTKKHPFIAEALVRMGYADKRIEYNPYRVVIYSFARGIVATSEDVEKVVQQLSRSL